MVHLALTFHWGNKIDCIVASSIVGVYTIHYHSDIWGKTSIKLFTFYFSNITAFLEVKQPVMSKQ